MNRAYIKSKLKVYEGLRLRNYPDSLGNNTIGYGHLNTENYTLITLEKAEAIFDVDVDIAIKDMESLSSKFGIPLPDKWENFLVMMVFQLGITKTKLFEKMLAALSNGYYSTAIKEVRNSRWYRQTTRRVEEMLRDVETKR